MNTGSERFRLIAAGFLLATMFCSPAWAQSSRAQKALEKRLVVTPSPQSKLLVNLLKSKTPFLTDRKYRTLKLPRGAFGGTLVVRNSRTVEQWLPAGQIIAKEDCKAYVAIQTRRNDELRVPRDLVDKMTTAGWEVDKYTFTTTSADKEIWIWGVYSKDVKKGPVTLKAPIKSRTAYVFMFK